MASKRRPSTSPTCNCSCAERLRLAKAKGEPASAEQQVVKAEPREMCDVELGGRDEDSEEEKPGTEAAAQHRFYGHRIGENIYFPFEFKFPLRG